MIIITFLYIVHDAAIDFRDISFAYLKGKR